MGQSIYRGSTASRTGPHQLVWVRFPARCRWYITFQTNYFPPECLTLQVEKEQEVLVSAAFSPHPFSVTFPSYKFPPHPTSFSYFIVTLLRPPYLHPSFYLWGKGEQMGANVCSHCAALIKMPVSQILMFNSLIKIFHAQSLEKHLHGNGRRRLMWKYKTPDLQLKKKKDPYL